MIGYCAICLASSNREIRFYFPGVIGIPFLAGLLISGNTLKTPALSPGSSPLAAALVFFFLIIAAIPTLHRADRQSIALGEAVVGEGPRDEARHARHKYLHVKLLIAETCDKVSSPKPDIELTPPLSFRYITGAPIEEISGYP